MKKEKISVLFVILVLMFVIFAVGIYVGKKLNNPSSSKEGIINESTIKNSLNSKDESKLISSNGKNQPTADNSLNFKPLTQSKLKNKKNIINKTKQKIISNQKSKPVKPIVKTKIVYVKKPVYVYKYIKIKPKTANAAKSASPFSSSIYYAIQVAALSNYKTAKNLANKLNKMGFFAYIIPISISGKNGKAVYQQVRVGKFSNEKDALSVEKVISVKFKIKPYIVKVN
ncbi:MAG: SPOR domain-containing protein [bacterium]